MLHPFEILEMVKTEKYKQPREWKDSECVKSNKYEINWDKQKISNLENDIRYLKDTIKPLLEEYNREMKYRQDLKDTINNSEKKHFFRKKD